MFLVFFFSPANSRRVWRSICIEGTDDFVQLPSDVDRAVKKKAKNGSPFLVEACEVLLNFFYSVALVIEVPGLDVKYLCRSVEDGNLWIVVHGRVDLRYFAKCVDGDLERGLLRKIGLVQGSKNVARVACAMPNRVKLAELLGIAIFIKSLQPRR